MSTTLKNIKIPYPTEGVIRSAQLDDTITPENSAQIAVNMHFDRVGAVTTRPGVATYATQLGGSIIAFGTLSIQGGIKRLYAQVGTIVSVWDGANWTAVLTESVSTKVRFSQYLNHVYAVNGTDPLVASAGSTFSAIAGFVPSAPAMPVGDYIQAGFNGRIWIANKAADALYYSDIVQFSPPSTYTVTYNVLNFIKDFSSQNGQSISGLFQVPKALLVFKQDSIFRVYNASTVDAYSAYNVGTYSQESIVQAKDGVYFHHSSGFYKFVYDGQPIEISRRIIDFVKAIPRTYYESVTGIFDGSDAVEWSIGPVTVEGVAYASCVVRYTISTQIWTIYDYGANVITSLIRYDDGTTLNPIMGTTAGKVGVLNSGLTDFGSPIYYEYIDRWRSYTQMWAHSKSISGVMVFTENAAGANVQYQTEKTPPNVWTYIDTINDNFDAIFPNANTDDFTSCRLRIEGNTSGTSMVFHGIEILSIQDKGLDQN